tara:strand:- start:271 stop:537 length:267 start_codon:yes stop_codon:yes gene_type:complete
MKKLLAIVVLGLAISCSDSETDYKKKSKMIEICADHEYPKNYRDYNSAVKGKALKIKLQKGKYERIFSACESYLKKNSITFKEKYLNK